MAKEEYQQILDELRLPEVAALHETGYQHQPDTEMLEKIEQIGSTKPQPPKHTTVYEPKSAYIVASRETDEECRVMSILERALLEQGIDVHTETDSMAAAHALNTCIVNPDLLFTGPGMDSIANYVESREISKGTYTTAVSTNGVRADFKLPDLYNLAALAKNDPGFFIRQYMRDDDSQRIRRENEELCRSLERKERAYSR